MKEARELPLETPLEYPFGAGRAVQEAGSLLCCPDASRYSAYSPFVMALLASKAPTSRLRSGFSLSQPKYITSLRSASGSFIPMLMVRAGILVHAAGALLASAS